jgi:hypothetical protein
MRRIALLTGIVVIAVMLVSSGVVGGALCVKNLGCVAASDGGLSVDRQEAVTLTAGNR